MAKFRDYSVGLQSWCDVSKVKERGRNSRSKNGKARGLSVASVSPRTVRFRITRLPSMLCTASSSAVKEDAKSRALEDWDRMGPSQRKDLRRRPSICECAVSWSSFVRVIYCLLLCDLRGLERLRPRCLANPLRRSYL